MFDYAAEIAAARLRYREKSLTVACEAGEFLRGKDGNITSQCGEDGLIAAAFERIGIANRWCFEVGAADGFRLSNTWALRLNGWRAVLIEGDDGEFEKLQGYRDSAVLVHEQVGSDSLDRILQAAGAPLDIDLGVIDIDGNDMYVWHGMRLFKPRVMLVEFNPSGDGVQGGTTQWQAGYETLRQAGAELGYRPLATTYHNALLVDNAAIQGRGL